MANITRPRGTRDFGPTEMARRRRVENILRNQSIKWGYQEVATPTFEHADLFIRRSGQEVVKQMYVFTDKGGRELALRPELTAPVARMYSEGLDRKYPKPLKLFYFGNAFRYERTQKGRYREFWQFGVECIGQNNVEADAEIIELAYKSLLKIGLSDIELKVGHIGLTHSILRKELGDDITEAITLIDKGLTDELEALFTDKVGQKKAGWLMEIFNFKVPFDKMEDASLDIPGHEKYLKDLNKLSKLLDSCGVKGTVSMDIVRGLDYYVGPVFEIEAPSLGAEKQICGGGRYDLSEVVGKKDIIATGFAIGFDRAILALGDIISTEKRNGCFVYPISDSEQEEAMILASHLRDQGIRCEADISGKKMKKAISYADSKGYQYFAVIGSTEMEKGTVNLRNLDTGMQKEIRRSDIGEFIGDTHGKEE